MEQVLSLHCPNFLMQTLQIFHNFSLQIVMEGFEEAKMEE